LEAELEELRCCLGQALDFVWAHGFSLTECLDNVSCRIGCVVFLGMHQGATAVLLVGELQTGYSLREVIGPPLALLDEGLKEMMKFYDEAASRVVHRLFVDDIVCNAPDPTL
jgi:hypothetical protein